MVVVLTEPGELTDGIVCYFGWSADNNNLLKIWSKVVGPKVVEVTSKTETLKWNAGYDEDQNLTQGYELLDDAVSLADMLELGGQAF